MPGELYDDYIDALKECSGSRSATEKVLALGPERIRQLYDHKIEGRFEIENMRDFLRDYRVSECREMIHSNTPATFKEEVAEFLDSLTEARQWENNLLLKLEVIFKSLHYRIADLRKCIEREGDKLDEDLDDETFRELCSKFRAMDFHIEDRLQFFEHWKDHANESRSVLGEAYQKLRSQCEKTLVEELPESGTPALDTEPDTEQKAPPTSAEKQDGDTTPVENLPNSSL